MRAGRRAGGVLVALAMAGCDLVLPLPEYQYAELDDLPAEGGTHDGAAIDSPAMLDDAGFVEEPAPPDAPEERTKNPCPSPNYACCGYTEEAGPGRLRCTGMGCANPATCPTCLALNCDPDEEFCCAPGGDTPPRCTPWGQTCEPGP